MCSISVEKKGFDTFDLILNPQLQRVKKRIRCLAAVTFSVYWKKVTRSNRRNFCGQESEGFNAQREGKKKGKQGGRCTFKYAPVLYKKNTEEIARDKKKSLNNCAHFPPVWQTQCKLRNFFRERVYISRGQQFLWMVKLNPKTNPNTNN